MGVKEKLNSFFYPFLGYSLHQVKICLSKTISEAGAPEDRGFPFCRLTQRQGADGKERSARHVRPRFLLCHPGAVRMAGWSTRKSVPINQKSFPHSKCYWDQKLSLYLS